MLDLVRIWSVLILLCIAASVALRGFGLKGWALGGTFTMHLVVILGFLTLMQKEFGQTALWGQVLLLFMAAITPYWWWRVRSLLGYEPRKEVLEVEEPELDFALLQRPKHNLAQCPYPHEHLAWE